MITVFREAVRRLDARIQRLESEKDALGTFAFTKRERLRGEITVLKRSREVLCIEHNDVAARETDVYIATLKEEYSEHRNGWFVRHLAGERISNEGD